MLHRTVLVTCVLCLGFLVLGISNTRSQGSGSSRVNPPQQPRRSQTPEEFARDFWLFINRPASAYTTWKTVEGQSPKDVQDPHGALQTTFVNSIVASNPVAPAFGSILVREDVAADGKTRSGTSVLYRVQGMDPKNFDWYWIQFQPDGTVAKNPEGKLLLGRATSCVQCHQQAQGGDLVFFNDQPAAPATK